MIESDLLQTLRALSACGEALTAIAEEEPNAPFGKVAPFNQRVLSGLALAVWRLADLAYAERQEAEDLPGNEIAITLAQQEYDALTRLAKQWGIPLEQAAGQITRERLQKIFTIVD